ncbi:30S ribosomal protein S20 [Candidatus Kaiserbacteria bacterium]|nr:30S ribosomal protein S20 [Candidatus Kaiserbacteria bacterium]MBI4079954.1 30S ribosomal protein S20 [Candidatus Kaiserbacteria bacterium]
MANTSSAKKAERSALRRRVFNERRKKAMKDIVKNVAKLIASKKGKEAETMLPKLFKALDKAAKGGTIKKNTAARMKSRLAKRIRAISA